LDWSWVQPTIENQQQTANNYAWLMIDVTNHVQPESTTDNFELIINTTNNAQPQPTIDNLQQHWVDYQYNHQWQKANNDQPSTFDWWLI
jgi:hypothetical protein